MSQTPNKVIITCAVTGSIHTPTMSDALPVTPDQIAEQAIGAAEAGAATCICTHVTRKTAARRRTRKSSCSFCRASSKLATRSSTSPRAAA